MSPEGYECLYEHARQLERELNAANERIAKLEAWIESLDQIEAHSGKDQDREWHGDIGWLYHGQVAYVGDAKPIEARKAKP